MSRTWLLLAHLGLSTSSGCCVGQLCINIWLDTITDILLSTVYTPRNTKAENKSFLSSVLTYKHLIIVYLIIMLIWLLYNGDPNNCLDFRCTPLHEAVLFTEAESSMEGIFVEDRMWQGMMQGCMTGTKVCRLVVHRRG